MRKAAVSLTAAALLLASAGAAIGQITTPSVLSSVDSSGGMPLYRFDIGTGAFDPTTIAFGQRVTGIAYNQAERRAYVLVRGTPPASNTTTSNLFYIDLNPLGSATFIAPTNGASNNNITSGGLAFDAANNRLIGSAQGRIYAIDPASAALTLIRDFGNGNSINGMDVDPVSGSLYFTQNTASSTTMIPTGRGVYRLDPPFETSNPVRIASYPIKPAGTGAGAQESDLDGLAAAPGVLYLSTDETNSLYRLNLSTLTYDAPVEQPYSPLTTVNVGGAAYVGSVTAGADLAIAIHNDASGVLPPAGQSTFVVNLRNVGTAAATASNAELVLPAGVSFVSATGGATFASGVVSFSAGELAPNAGASFTVTLSSANPFTATAVSTTSAGDVFIGNNTASVLSTAGAPDLIVSVVAPANCSVVPGGDAAFNINVLNGGPRAVAGTLTIPIPAGASFVSSTPPGVAAGGIVSIDLGVVAPGAAAPVTATFTPSDGITFGITATATLAGDANPADNTASAATTTANFSTAPIRALLATNAASANVPNMVGSLVAGRTIDSVRSANGEWLITRWQASVNNQDDVLLLTSLPGGATTVIAQEGTTVLPNGQMPMFDAFTGSAVNNAGDYAFSGRAVSSLDYAVKSIGGVSTMIAFEGDPAPAITGGTAYGSGSSVQLSNSNVVSYIWSFTGLTGATDEFALTQNDSVVLYQDGSTVPGTGGPQTDIQNVGFYTSADGTRYLYEGRSSISSVTRTTAVVGTSGGTDQTALIIAGNTLPGMSSPTAAIPLDGGTVMTPEGRWFVRGTNDDGEDWVISGTGNTVDASNVIHRTGPTGAPMNPIIPGSTELWSPGGTAVMAIWANTANPRGDVLIVGETTGVSVSNFVFVLNGTTVLAREGDPVDTNNNGIFDDDSYIRGLQARDTVVLTDEAMYAVVTLRDRAGVCSDAATTINTALIRIPIPQPTNDFCCRGTTCNTVASGTCTGAVAGSNSLVVTSCGAGNALASCCFADFNHVGGVTIDDLFLYLNAYFTNSPYANFGGDTIAGPTIDDLFLYINAYFTGCI